MTTRKRAMTRKPPTIDSPAGGTIGEEPLVPITAKVTSSTRKRLLDEAARCGSNLSDVIRRRCEADAPDRLPAPPSPPPVQIIPMIDESMLRRIVAGALEIALIDMRRDIDDVRQLQVTVLEKQRRSIDLLVEMIDALLRSGGDPS